MVREQKEVAGFIALMILALVIFLYSPKWLESYCCCISGILIVSGVLIFRVVLYFRRCPNCSRPFAFRPVGTAESEKFWQCKNCGYQEQHKHWTEAKTSPVPPASKKVPKLRDDILPRK